MFQQRFFSWFSTFLKDKGLQFTRCGSKYTFEEGKHTIDLETGGWELGSYSSNKPPRWLYHVESIEDGLCATAPVEGSCVIGQANTSQADKAGIVLRILPLIGNEDTGFAQSDDLEVCALFVFLGPTPQGSSSNTFSFDVNTGIMTFRDEPLPYIVGGLLGLQEQNTELRVDVGEDTHEFTYGELLEALSKSINVHSANGLMGPIPIYDLTEETDYELIRRTINDTWLEHVEGGEDVDDDDEVVEVFPREVQENKELIGIEEGVYRQINALLNSGKQHIMLYGPPGTGKTTLARWLASSLTGTSWILMTASADWSSQDLVGGYQPVGGGDVAFVPGILLRNFDKPLIIDELNRCDIDKVIGPLFTVLSGQHTTLPYRTKIEDPGSQHYVILPEYKANRKSNEYAPGPAWRIIATINSIDKASLYQMSYALSRRFGWVYIDAPTDTRAFVTQYLGRDGPGETEPPLDVECPLADFWTQINLVRPLGPAPIIDSIETIRQMDSEAEFFGRASASMKTFLLDAIDMVFLPLLDGIPTLDGDTLAEESVRIFELDEKQANRIRDRMKSVAV